MPVVPPWPLQPKPQQAGNPQQPSTLTPNTFTQDAERNYAHAEQAPPGFQTAAAVSSQMASQLELPNVSESGGGAGQAPGSSGGNSEGALGTSAAGAGGAEADEGYTDPAAGAVPDDSAHSGDYAMGGIGHSDKFALSLKSNSVANLYGNSRQAKKAASRLGVIAAARQQRRYYEAAALAKQHAAEVQRIADSDPKAAEAAQQEARWALVCCAEATICAARPMPKDFKLGQVQEMANRRLDAPLNTLELQMMERFSQQREAIVVNELAVAANAMANSQEEEDDGKNAVDAAAGDDNAPALSQEELLSQVVGHCDVLPDDTDMTAWKKDLRTSLKRASALLEECRSLSVTPASSKKKMSKKPSVKLSPSDILFNVLCSALDVLLTVRQAGPDSYRFAGGSGAGHAAVSLPQSVRDAVFKVGKETWIRENYLVGKVVPLIRSAEDLRIILASLVLLAEEYERRRLLVKAQATYKTIYYAAIEFFGSQTLRGAGRGVTAAMEQAMYRSAVLFELFDEISNAVQQLRWVLIAPFPVQAETRACARQDLGRLLLWSCTSSEYKPAPIVGISSTGGASVSGRGKFEETIVPRERLEESLIVLLLAEDERQRVDADVRSLGVTLFDEAVAGLALNGAYQACVSLNERLLSSQVHADAGVEDDIGAYVHNYSHVWPQFVRSLAAAQHIDAALLVSAQVCDADAASDDSLSRLTPAVASMRAGKWTAAADWARRALGVEDRYAEKNPSSDGSAVAAESSWKDLADSLLLPTPLSVDCAIPMETAKATAPFPLHKRDQTRHQLFRANALEILGWSTLRANATPKDPADAAAQKTPIAHLLEADQLFVQAHGGENLARHHTALRLSYAYALARDLPSALAWCRRAILRSQGNFAPAWHMLSLISAAGRNQLLLDALSICADGCAPALSLGSSAVSGLAGRPGCASMLGSLARLHQLAGDAANGFATMHTAFEQWNIENSWLTQFAVEQSFMDERLQRQGAVQRAQDDTGLSRVSRMSLSRASVKSNRSTRSNGSSTKSVVSGVSSRSWVGVPEDAAMIVRTLESISDSATSDPDHTGIVLSADQSSRVGSRRTPALDPSKRELRNLWLLLGEMFLDEGRHADANECVARAMQLKEALSAEIFFLQGRIDEALDQARRAAECYGRAIALDAKHTKSLVRLGALALETVLDEALNSAQGQRKSSPLPEALRCNLALAEKYLQSAVESDPSDPEAWLFLGRVHEYARDAKAAAACFERSLDAEAAQSPIPFQVILPGLEQGAWC